MSVWTGETIDPLKMCPWLRRTAVFVTKPLWRMAPESCLVGFRRWIFDAAGSSRDKSGGSTRLSAVMDATSNLSSLPKKKTLTKCVRAQKHGGGEPLFSLVWTNQVIQNILFPWNSIKDRPIGTDLMTFCTKNIKFSSTRATITTVFIGLYRFKVNPWLQIRFLSFVHRF